MAVVRRVSCSAVTVSLGSDDPHPYSHCSDPCARPLSQTTARGWRAAIDHQPLNHPTTNHQPPTTNRRDDPCPASPPPTATHHRMQVYRSGKSVVERVVHVVGFQLVVRTVDVVADRAELAWALELRWVDPALIDPDISGAMASRSSCSVDPRSRPPAPPSPRPMSGSELCAVARWHALIGELCGGANEIQLRHQASQSASCRSQGTARSGCPG